jgi:hypothetical protein
LIHVDEFPLLPSNVNSYFLMTHYPATQLLSKLTVAASLTRRSNLCKVNKAANPRIASTLHLLLFVFCRHSGEAEPTRPALTPSPRARLRFLDILIRKWDSAIAAADAEYCGEIRVVVMEVC